MYTPDFAAYAGRIHARFKRPRSATELRQLAQDFMSTTAIGCGEAGATLVGHIKCIAEAGKGGFVTCSATDSSGKVRCKGEFGGEARRLDLVLNVLVYGLDRSKIEDVVVRASDTVLAGTDSFVEIEDLAVEHEHEHEHVREHAHEDQHETH
ncbi:MAG: hypothetical protein ABSB83_01215 [Methanomassiliicoccales archaeon]